MKTIKAIIAWYCYLGTGMIAVDQVTGLDIPTNLGMNTAQQAVVIYLLIVFWVIKIAWFVYDKFYLTRKERGLEMDRKREEITGMKFNNEKGGHHTP